MLNLLCLQFIEYPCSVNTEVGTLIVFFYVHSTTPQRKGSTSTTACPQLFKKSCSETACAHIGSRNFFFSSPQRQGSIFKRNVTPQLQMRTYLKLQFFRQPATSLYNYCCRAIANPHTHNRLGRCGLKEWLKLTSTARKSKTV
jgi:hypothetical protein